jgi:hypothetical protein
MAFPKQNLGGFAPRECGRLSLRLNIPALDLGEKHGFRYRSKEANDPGGWLLGVGWKIGRERESLT